MADDLRTELQRRVDLDFGHAPSHMMLRMLSDIMSVPIVLRGEIPAQVNIRMKDVPAIEALDELLAQAGTKRIEIPAIRIVPGSADQAHLLGGEPISGSSHDAELRHVLDHIERGLGMPIVVRKDIAPRPVRIQLDETPAGLALQQVLGPEALGFESYYAFEISPEDEDAVE